MNDYELNQYNSVSPNALRYIFDTKGNICEHMVMVDKTIAVPVDVYGHRHMRISNYTRSIDTGRVFNTCISGTDANNFKEYFRTKEDLYALPFVRILTHFTDRNMLPSFVAGQDANAPFINGSTNDGFMERQAIILQWWNEYKKDLWIAESNYLANNYNKKARKFKDIISQTDEMLKEFLASNRVKLDLSAAITHLEVTPNNEQEEHTL